MSACLGLLTVRRSVHKHKVRQVSVGRSRWRCRRADSRHDSRDSGDGQEMWRGWGLPTFVPLLTLDSFRAAHAARPLSRYGYARSAKPQTASLKPPQTSALRRPTDNGQRQHKQQAESRQLQQHQAPCRPWDGIHCKCCCESSTLFDVRSASSAYDIDSVRVFNNDSRMNREN